MRRLGPIALAALVAMPAATASADIGGPAIVKKVNAMRVAHGFPPVRHDAAHSAGCRLHARYMRLHPRDGHVERRGARGYTAAGAQAGITSELAFTSWRRGNPWVNAPMHLAGQLQPSDTTAGGYEHNAGGDAFVCGGNDFRDQSPPPRRHTFWSFPGKGRSIQNAQRASEVPYLPQQRAGIPARRITGPNLLVFWRGPAGTQLHAADAVLEGSDGSRPAVKLVVVGTKRFATVDGAAEYGATDSAYLIPVRPLKARRTYRASVVWQTDPKQVFPGNPPARVVQVFSFKTRRFTLTGNGARCPLAGC